MAHILGPDFISLQVRNLESATQFYTEKLGLVPRPQSPPNAVVFQTDSIPFAIRQALPNFDESAHPGWGVALWLKCDQADVLCAKLEAEGIKIAQSPFDGPFGRTFVFVDPDGYAITVHGDA